MNHFSGNQNNYISTLSVSLTSRKKLLESVIQKANKILINAPSENLDILQQGAHYRYYAKSSQKSNSTSNSKRYLKSNDINLAAQIANRDYAKQVLDRATKELSKVKSLLSLYNSKTVDDCYSALHPGRKQLISPFIINNDEYASQWLSIRNPIQNSYPIHTPIFTENNEHVRSKSEKIIADKLALMNIPYKYEEALTIGKHTIFPDFTVLNKSSRKEYYWEHFGLLDKEDYLENALKKLDFYSQNNIILGCNLIITYETQVHPLSVKNIEALALEFLC